MKSTEINLSFLAAGIFAHLLHDGQNAFSDSEIILDELVSYSKLKLNSILKYISYLIIIFPQFYYYLPDDCCSKLENSR